jgi:hypothetical protein
MEDLHTAVDDEDEEFRFATLNDHEIDIEDEPDESKEDTSTKEDEDEEDEENDEATFLADLLDAKVVIAVMNANIGDPTRLGYRRSLQRFIVYLFGRNIEGIEDWAM